MNKTTVQKLSELAVEHTENFEGYSYIRKDVVSEKDALQCRVAVYEISPGRSAYPYHYHLKNEEVFYIISGQGLLRTPDGERKVSQGNFMFFPANENGAHKLTNISETESLVYIDFDTENNIDIAVYPDSKKIGIWGKDVDKLYLMDRNVRYYEGE